VLREADFNYKDFLKALHTFGLSGTAICESPNLEQDALLLQQVYQELA
jgi:deoxyribonuclease-4